MRSLVEGHDARTMERLENKTSRSQNLRSEILMNLSCIC